MSLRTYVPFLLEFPSSSQIPLFSAGHCLLKVESTSTLLSLTSLAVAPMWPFPAAIWTVVNPLRSV